MRAHKFGILFGLSAAAIAAQYLPIDAGPWEVERRSRKGAFVGKGQKKANKANRWR